MGKNARLKRQRKETRTPTTGQLISASPSISDDKVCSKSSPRSLSAIWHVIFVAAIFGLCYARGIFPIESEDIFSNIVTGGYLWHTQSIPDVDPFSFTGPYHWYVNRPLPSIIFYAIHALGGLPAVQIFCLAIISLAYTTLYLVWARRTGLPVVVFGLSALAIMASCYWFQTRIYVFAYLWMVCALLLISSPVKRGMMWAIPLQVIWINTHPSAIMGVILVGFWWLREIFSHRRFGRFETFILISVILSNLVSPMGVASFGKFAEELFAAHPSRTNIFEWFSPFNPTISTQHLAWWFYAACALAVPICYQSILRFSGLKAGKILLPIAIMLFLMSTKSARHIPLFHFCFIGLIAATVKASLEGTRKWSDRFNSPAAACAVLTLVWIIIGKSIMFGYSNGAVERKFSLGIDKRKFPDRAIGMLKSSKIGGNIFSEYALGSYFLYKMYPEYKTYIDSARLDEVYGEDGFLHYMRLGNDVALLRNDIEKYDIRAFILPLPPSESEVVAIYRYLSTNTEWRLAYFDGNHLVYVLASEAALRNIPTFAFLNPFGDMQGLVKKNPDAISGLERDFNMADSMNVQSLPLFILKASFYSSIGNRERVEETLKSMDQYCARIDPSQACREMAARTTVRFMSINKKMVPNSPF